MTPLLFSAVFLAYVVKGLCGFANTLVFGTVMSFSRDNLAVSPLDLVLSFPANFVLAWKNRKQISFRTCVPLCLIMLAGSTAGTFLLKNGSPAIVKILFGIVITGVSSYLFYGEYHPGTGAMHPAVLALIGAAAGVMSGMFGIGALLAAYIGQTSKDDSEFKGNINFIFFVENVFRMILYPATGILTLELFREGLMLLPVMAAGLCTGMVIAEKMNGKLLKKAVIIALLLSGVSLVITSALKL